MSHNQDDDFEMESQHQMRDVVLWGSSAVVATVLALSIQMWGGRSNSPQITSLAAGSPQEAVNQIKNSPYSNVDDTVTGSIQTKIPEKLSSTSGGSAANSSYGTTIATRQPNADSIRRMRGENSYPGENGYQVETKLTKPGESTVTISNEIVVEGPVGIDLGVGYSFSVLGKRYTALVNSAPTLFANLNARAAIVENSSNIEARLIAGPVKDVETANQLCIRIRQRVNTPCTPAKFTGRPLKLY